MSEELYDPSDSDRNAINHVYDRMYKMQHMRDRRYNYFNDRNLIDFIDDSTKRWNGYIPPRDDLTMDWQARTFQNFTRNTVISFLSKVALKRPKTKFMGANKEMFDDVRRAQIMQKLHDWSRLKEKGDTKFFHAALEVVTKGTVIGYEGYKRTKRKMKVIDSFDPINGSVTYKDRDVIDYDDCFQHIIPLEDMYVGNVWQSDIQLQPDIIWKSLMRKVEAEIEFSKYKNWGKVKGGAYTTMVEQQPFYKTKVYAELEVDQVEVIRYFNRFTDTLSIVANGVLIYHGPIPFKHKMYPFSKGIFEPFAVDFFYGNSLPNKIASDQDVINTLWNMMLDQSYLSIFKPVLTDDPDEIEDTILIPGLVKKVNNVESYRVLNELTGPDPSHFQMLQNALRFATENSGPVFGGGRAASPQGGRVTARQSLLVEEQARQIMGLNSRMLEEFDADAAYLRGKNILQFYTVPSKIEEVSGVSGEEYRQQFLRTVKVEDTDLSDGTKGTAMIVISQTEDEQPTKEELAVTEEMAAQQGKNVEVISISADYIRHFDFDVMTVAESSYMSSKSIEQALGLEFYQIMAANPLVNQQENTREVIKLYEKDPDRFLQGQTAPMTSPESPAPPQAGSSPSAQILGRNSAQSIQAMMGETL